MTQVESRRCACRGWLVTNGQDDIPQVVRAHRQTIEHRRWDSEAWSERHAALLTVRVLRVDKSDGA